jgi:hypothetical protein
MKRREFVTLLGGAAAWPLTARARQRESLRQVAVLIGPAESDIDAQRRIGAFRERMQGLGWVDGSDRDGERVGAASWLMPFAAATTAWLVYPALTAPRAHNGF